MLSVAVVGYGRLGKRLVDHLAGSCNVTCLVKKEVHEASPINFTQDPRELSKVTHIIPAIKPKDHSSLNYKLTDSQFLISPMAGINVKTLRDTYGGRVMRIMPNIYLDPVPCWSNSKDLTDSQIDKLFNIHLVLEEDLDIVTKCYGCAPALIAWMYKKFSTIDEELTMKVFESTLRDLQVRSPDAIIDDVRSPGGVTSRLLEIMDNTEISTALQR